MNDAPFDEGNDDGFTSMQMPAAGSINMQA